MYANGSRRRRSKLARLPRRAPREQSWTSFAETRRNARMPVVTASGKSENDESPCRGPAPETSPTSPSRAQTAEMIASAISSCLPKVAHRARLLRPRTVLGSSKKGASSAEMMKKTPPRPNPGSPGVISVSFLVDEERSSQHEFPPHRAQHEHPVDDAEDEEAGQAHQRPPELPTPAGLNEHRHRDDRDVDEIGDENPRIDRDGKRGYQDNVGQGCEEERPRRRPSPSSAGSRGPAGSAGGGARSGRSRATSDATVC